MEFKQSRETPCLRRLRSSRQAVRIFPDVSDIFMFSSVLRGRGEAKGAYIRENGTICPFGVLLPCFIRLFASKLDIFPLKCSVSGV